MRRRRLLLGAKLLTLFGLVCFIVVWLNLPRPGITEANFDRIRKGMTQADVEVILDGSPGIYGGTKPADLTRPISIKEHTQASLGPLPKLRWEVWVREPIRIWVGFDANGQVANKEFELFLGTRRM